MWVQIQDALLISKVQIHAPYLSPHMTLTITIRMSHSWGAVSVGEAVLPASSSVTSYSPQITYRCSLDTPCMPSFTGDSLVPDKQKVTIYIYYSVPNNSPQWMCKFKFSISKQHTITWASAEHRTAGTLLTFAISGKVYHQVQHLLHRSWTPIDKQYHIRQLSTNPIILKLCW
jgi:hypothetical protein